MRSCLLLQRPLCDPAALSCGAGGVVLDLSSSDVFGSGLDWLRRARESSVAARIFVKTPSLDEASFFHLLKELAAAPPDGFLLAAAESAAQAQRLTARLAVFEAEVGAPDGTIPIFAEISTPAGALGLLRFGARPRRLTGLLFAGAKLAACLGVDVDAAPILRARAEAVLLAAALDVPALDDACGAAAALEAECCAARRDGFSGKCATRPDEIATIEAAFGEAGVEKSPQSAPYLRT